MAKLMLVNPRKRNPVGRRRRRTHARRRNPVAARAVSALSRRRRRNPVSTSYVFHGRSRNPVGRRRRRRNPIGGLSSGSSKQMMNMIKDALLGGAGAVAVDVAMGQINTYLPASMQTIPGTVGVGDAVKAAITVVLGKVFAKPTKGLSVKMAQGALVVQAANILRTFVPSTMPMAGVGYFSPASITGGSNRVGPTRMAAYTPGSALLSRGPGGRMGKYTSPGVTSLLNGIGSAREREGAVR